MRRMGPSQGCTARPAPKSTCSSGGSTARPLPCSLLFHRHVHCLFHFPFSACSLPGHCPGHCPVHCPFTALSLLVHCLFTACSLPCSLPLHCPFTAMCTALLLPFHGHVRPFHCLFPPVTASSRGFDRNRSHLSQQDEPFCVVSQAAGGGGGSCGGGGGGGQAERRRPEDTQRVRHRWMAARWRDC